MTGYRCNLCLEPEEKAILIKAASKYQLKLASYIRRVALEHAKATLALNRALTHNRDDRVVIDEDMEE